MSYLYAGTIRNWQGMILAATALTVYTDAAGTVAATGLTDLVGTAIANPLTTDDRGRIAANGYDGIKSVEPTLYYKATGDTRTMRLLRFNDLTQASVAVGDFPNAVRDFGAVGNGTADDTAALNDAFTNCGGPLVLPAGTYKVTDSLIPVSGVKVIAGGFISAAGTSPVSIVGNGGFAIIDGTGITVNDFGIDGVSFYGSESASGSRAIYAENANNWNLRNIFGSGFANQGIYIRGGVAGVYENVWMQGACMKRADHLTYVGAVQFGDAAHWVSDLHCRLVGGYCGGWDGAAGAYESGYHCGLLAGASMSVFDFCYGSWSETGIKTLTAVSDGAQFTNCRADHNEGHGFDVAGGGQTYIGCQAFNNSQDADATYSGFRVHDGTNIFEANTIAGLVGFRHQLYGFDDDCDTGTIGNHYGSSNRADVYTSGGLYHITSWAQKSLIMGMSGRRLKVFDTPVMDGGAIHGSGFEIGAGPCLIGGALDPSAAAGVPAVQGSIFMRTDGGASTSIYIKTGAGDTAWTAK